MVTGSLVLPCFVLPLARAGWLVISTDMARIPTLGLSLLMTAVKSICSRANIKRSRAFICSRLAVCNSIAHAFAVEIKYSGSN